MVDKVKLTPPMTDSKTPDMDVAKAIERAIERLQNLHDYAGNPTWERVIREELDAVSSQALLSAYERGRKEGIEEAAKVAAADDGKAPGGWGNPDFGPNVARRIATAIRQLLEGK
jgi:hypothetical protein